MDTISEFLNSLLLSQGSLGQALIAVLAAYLGGVLSSLTPCVYPMIPITVSVVGGISGTARARGELQWKGILARSSAYIGGMTLIYSFLGVTAGLTGKIFGTITNTSGWYLGLGLIMTLGALIMLDVIPFDPMLWWNHAKHRFQKRSKKHNTYTAPPEQVGLIGAFVLGASSGFIAAPCTTPVLTAILAYIAKTQSIGLGLALMVAFSLGLGTLLLIIAAFTGAVQILPRSGNWMKTVKMISGLILLVFADYLIYRAGNLGGP